MTTIYLGLGSNMGDRESNLEGALRMLAHKVTIGKISSVYETEPVGYSEQPWFLNLVCCGETRLGPFDLLSFAKDIEARLGRIPSFPNAPRPIDIDILFYDQEIMDTEELSIPHPRINERAFVLIPLADVALSLFHPALGKTIEVMVSELEDTKLVRKWGDVSSIGSTAF